QLIERTATNPSGTFSNDSGFGEVNMEGAIKAGSEWVDIVNPAQGKITPNFAEPITFRIVKPLAGSGPASTADFQLKRNVTLPDASDGIDITNNAVPVDPNTGLFDFQPDFSGTPETGFWTAGGNGLGLFVFGSNGRVRSITGPAVANTLGNNVPQRSYSF